MHGKSFCWLQVRTWQPTSTWFVTNWEILYRKLLSIVKFEKLSGLCWTIFTLKLASVRWPCSTHIAVCDHSHSHIANQQSVQMYCNGCPVFWCSLYVCRESNCLPCWTRTLLWWNAESSYPSVLTSTKQLGTRLTLWPGSRLSATHSFHQPLNVRKQIDRTIHSLQTARYIKLQHHLAITETGGYVFFSLMRCAEYFPFFQLLVWELSGINSFIWAS